MINSRAKGKRGELKQVHRWKAAGWEAKRGFQSRDGTEDPDVVVSPRSILVDCNAVRTPSYRCEVKTTSALPSKGSLNAYAQAEAAATAGQVPVAIFHEHRGRDFVFLELGDFLWIAGCYQGDNPRGTTEQRAGDTSEPEVSDG